MKVAVFSLFFFSMVFTGEAKYLNDIIKGECTVYHREGKTYQSEIIKYSDNMITVRYKSIFLKFMKYEVSQIEYPNGDIFSPDHIDMDEDGVFDQNDKCPKEKEDRDGYQDEDGCPDPDNDGDSIADNDDKCPYEKEDLDQFEDTDGCIDSDNDKDGLADANDKCPNQAETMNRYQDEDGCPDNKPTDRLVKEIKKGRMILKGVNFRTGSANLTFESYEVLNRVYESLQAYPDVMVEIRGYTDSQGNYSSNKKLSLRRAQSVKDYIVQRGVDPMRMSVRGFGSENPIATNRTADGRAQNRRIEFFRVK